MDVISVGRIITLDEDGRICVHKPDFEIVLEYCAEADVYDIWINDSWHGSRRLPSQCIREAERILQQ